MTQTLVKISADISTTIASKTAIWATSFTLTSATDDDGNALAAGTYGFTIDRKNSSKEYCIGVLSGTSITSVKTIARWTGAGTSWLAREHRKGAEIIISDWVALRRAIDLLDWTTNFDSGSPLGYDWVPALVAGSNKFATVKYADDLAIAGSPKATEATYGISKLSTAAVDALIPIVVGDNDTRVPTQDENNALAWTSGTAPSASNKFVDNADTAKTWANKVLRLTSAWKVTTSTIDTWVTDWKIIMATTGDKLPVIDGSNLTNIGIDGIDTTERSQVWWGSVADMVTISCSIPVYKYIKISAQYRTAWGTGWSFFWFTLNSTQVIADSWHISTSSATANWYIEIIIPPRETWYELSWHAKITGAWTTTATVQFGSNMPVATITSIKLRGSWANWGVTLYYKNVIVTTY